MAELDLPDELRDEARTAWHRFLDHLNPIRPALYAYCRKLAGNPWDADDLVQDTLVRAFATLGIVHRTIESPRAYLLRIASNLWIDHARRRGAEAAALERSGETASAETPSPALSASVRSASATLLRELSPQEQAAVVLKDVFDLDLAETAAILSTSVGAVKAALHGGRTRLRQTAAAAPRRPAASAELVDRFIAALETRDLPGLLALMLDTGSIETGYLVENGRKAFEQRGSWLWSAVYGHPDRPTAAQGLALRHVRAALDGEPVALSLSQRDGREGLTSVLRFEELDGRLARVRAFSSPEVVRELAAALDLPCHTYGLYRPPTPGPGKYWTPRS